MAISNGVGAGVILSVMGGGVFTNVLAAPNAWPTEVLAPLFVCAGQTFSIQLQTGCSCLPLYLWAHHWVGHRAPRPSPGWVTSTRLGDASTRHLTNARRVKSMPTTSNASRSQEQVLPAMAKAASPRWIGVGSPSASYGCTPSVWTATSNRRSPSLLLESTS